MTGSVEGDQRAPTTLHTRAEEEPRSEDDDRVGRLAPSPTGPLHLGHAYAFLHAWWWTRSRGGRMRLRWDDGDRTRCRPEFEDQALADLEWLGLTWDGPVVRQSDRGDAHEAALKELSELGVLFGCQCTRKDLAAQAAPHEGEEVSYPGTCSALGLPGPALRMRVPGSPVEVEEHCARLQDGDAVTRIDLSAEGGPFLVASRTGIPSYQLVTAVDDAAMGVTDVARGRDLLTSLGRQQLIRQRLGLGSVAAAHLPLVVDASGRRLAKRSRDLALSSLREAGVAPRAVLAWALTDGPGPDCDFVGTSMSEAHRQVVAKYRLPAGHSRTAPSIDALLESS